MGHFPLNSNAVVVVIDLKHGQRRDRFEIVVENVHSQRNRGKSWLETLVGFRLSREPRDVRVCVSPLFFWYAFQQPIRFVQLLILLVSQKWDLLIHKNKTPNWVKLNWSVKTEMYVPGK